MILPLLKVAGRAVAHSCSAVGTVYHAGKHAALARFRPAVALLANLLHLFKDFLIDDRWMGAVEDRLLLGGRFPLLLVPDGIGVRLEVDRTACVFPPFQNTHNRVGIPTVRIGGLRARCVDALPPLVSGGVEHLFLPQEFGNLHRASPFHAQLEDAFDYHRRCFIHDPLCLVRRVFAIAKWNISCQRYATLSLCLLHGSDFATGIFGKELVELVLDSGNVAVRAVRVDGIKVVVDGDIPYSVLRKSEVDIQPRQ